MVLDGGNESAGVVQILVTRRRAGGCGCTYHERQRLEALDLPEDRLDVQKLCSHPRDEPVRRRKLEQAHAVMVMLMEASNMQLS